MDESEFQSINGIIDFGNCFYGDPYADFIGAVHLYNDVSEEKEFMEGYSEITGKPLVVTQSNWIRMNLYRLYLEVIVYVEAYRYSDEKRKSMVYDVVDER